MNFFRSFILSSIVFLLSFQGTLFLLDYHLNQEKYEALCENKNRPELECHGKCSLKKETEKQPTLQQVLKIDFNFLPPAEVMLRSENFSVSYITITTTFLNPNLCGGYLTSLLRPPIFNETS